MAPKLAVVVAPLDPTVGQAVQFRVRAAEAAAKSDYRWDLDGSGRFAVDTGTASSLAHVYPSPGPQTVSVRVTTGPITRAVTVTMIVRSRPHRRSSRSLSVTRESGATPSREFRARVAGDPGVSIVDFSFAPSTTTIHVGESITWTNTGAAPHTATARDGSYDSGILARGQSASHTFTHAGTFAFYCTVHPFMHSTIVVVGSSGAGAPVTSAAGSSASTGQKPRALTSVATGARAPASPKSAATLPVTGLDVRVEMLVGLVLGGIGLTIRRAYQKLA